MQLKLESAKNLHIARPACRQPMMEYSVKDTLERGLFSWDSFSLFLRNKSPSLEQILSVNGSLGALLWSVMLTVGNVENQTIDSGCNDRDSWRWNGFSFALPF